MMALGFEDAPDIVSWVARVVVVGDAARVGAGDVVGVASGVGARNVVGVAAGVATGVVVGGEAMSYEVEMCVSPPPISSTQLTPSEAW